MNISVIVSASASTEDAANAFIEDLRQVLLIAPDGVEISAGTAAVDDNDPVDLLAAPPAPPTVDGAIAELSTAAAALDTHADDGTVTLTATQAAALRAAIVDVEDVVTPAAVAAAGPDAVAL